MTKRCGYHLGVYLGHDCGVAVVDGEGNPVLVAEESKFCGYKSPFFHPMWALRALQSLNVNKFKTLTWAMPKKVPEGCYHFDFFKYVESIRSALSGHMTNFLNWDHEYFTVHHEAHAESAFWPSHFAKALVLIIDGSGEDDSLSLFLGDRKAKLPLRMVEKLKTKEFSYGHFYDLMTKYLGYRQGRGSDHCGKIMGLSSYGSARHLKFFRSNLRPDTQLFPRRPSDFNQRLLHAFGSPYPRPISGFDGAQADIAASAQGFLEEEILRLLRIWRKQYSQYSCLCLAGGVALNSVMNGRILRGCLFDDLFVQPMASDSGLAFGAALQGARRSRTQALTSATWAHAYHGYRHENDTNELAEVLAGYELPLAIITKNCSVAAIAERLANGRIVGLFQGAQEVGARSLGNRSIITLPTAEHKERVNNLVKYRESWRPFAPVVVESEIEGLFGNARSEPFMTIVYDVRPDYRKTLAGITHVDGTARVQSVTDEQNPFLYGLLQELSKRGLPPVLLNTSFNVNGQPIVRTVYDAVMTFLCSGIDDLVIGRSLLNKTDKRLFPVTAVSCLDRMLEPVVRHIHVLNILILEPDYVTLQDLKTLLELPCIKSRSRKCPITLGSLYCRPGSLNVVWEILSEVSDQFSNADGTLPSARLKDGEGLLIVTGSKSAMDFMCHETGRIREANVPDRHFVRQVTNITGSQRVYFVDHFKHLVPATYYFEVVHEAGHHRPKLDYYQEGLLLKSQGRRDDAIEKFEAALEVVPGHRDAKKELAYLLKELGQFRRALGLFEDLAMAEPLRGDWIMEQIDALVKLGLREKAEAVYALIEGNKAVILNDYQQGLCLKLLKRHEEALERFQTALVKQGESAEIYMEIGHMFMFLKRLEDALFSFQRVMELEPLNICNKYMIVRVLAKLGRFEEGLNLLMDIKRVHEQEVASNPYMFGNHLKMIQQYDDAIKVLDEVDRSKPKFYDSRYQKAGAIAQIGRSYEAQGDIDNALSKYSEAIECFEELVVTCPERVDARLSMSDVFMYMKRYDEALQTLAEIEKIEPENELIIYKRKQIYDKSKQYEIIFE